MRKHVVVVFGEVFFVLLSACVPRESTSAPVDVSAVQTTVVQTVFAGATQTVVANVPTDTPTLAFTDTPEVTATSPIPTNTSIKTFVPLYWEVAWENLGLSERELVVNEQTNERVTLSGYAYQAPLPSEKK